MQANRRSFLKLAGAAAAALALPAKVTAAGGAPQVVLAQLVYPGGNWRPRTTALRRLVWELHKRTAVEADLEPAEVKLTTAALSATPFVYMSGDRPFPEPSEASAAALGRFLRLGGALVVDPAFTEDGDADGFGASVDGLMARALPGVPEQPLPGSHVLYRAFYKVARPVGRVEGPAELTAYTLGDRLAAIRTRHDLGGAWARDNLGNWEIEVTPGGERQREAAFRLGINLVLYALCLDYKNEEPHRRFNRRMVTG
jgi:hypothetical protein